MAEEIMTKNLDPIQADLLKENCILVTSDDKVIGSLSKKDCHLWSNIKNNNTLHRAFSVFLFNFDGKLLLQQRSHAKITFPGYFTNTCCSHPLYTANEMEEEGAIGVKRAAKRKLNQELGIPLDQISIEEMHYLSRVHYKAMSDGVWGEHEIDYILFIILARSVDVNINTNEVKTYRYVSQLELKELLLSAERNEVKITPWFKLICDNFLFNWWDKLDRIEECKDTHKIHRLC